jgi:hypothetical protein
MQRKEKMPSRVVNVVAGFKFKGTGIISTSATLAGLCASRSGDTVDGGSGAVVVRCEVGDQRADRTRRATWETGRRKKPVL